MIDDVAIQRGRAVVGNADVDDAVGAEPGGRFPCCGIESEEARSSQEHHTRGGCSVTGPVSDTALRRHGHWWAATATPTRRRSQPGRWRRGRRRLRVAHRRGSCGRRSRHGVRPDLFAAVGIERNNLRPTRRVHHSADDERYRGRSTTESIGPRLLQRANVGRVDLGQRR